MPFPHRINVVFIGDNVTQIWVNVLCKFWRFGIVRVLFVSVAGFGFVCDVLNLMTQGCLMCNEVPVMVGCKFCRMVGFEFHRMVWCANHINIIYIGVMRWPGDGVMRWPGDGVMRWPVMVWCADPGMVWCTDPGMVWCANPGMMWCANPGMMWCANPGMVWCADPGMVWCADRGWCDVLTGDGVMRWPGDGVVCWPGDGVMCWPGDGVMRWPEDAVIKWYPYNCVMLPTSVDLKSSEDIAVIISDHEIAGEPLEKVFYHKPVMACVSAWQWLGHTCFIEPPVPSVIDSWWESIMFIWGTHLEQSSARCDYGVPNNYPLLINGTKCELVGNKSSTWVLLVPVVSGAISMSEHCFMTLDTWVHYMQWSHWGFLISPQQYMWRFHTVVSWYDKEYRMCNFYIFSSPFYW